MKITKIAKQPTRQRYNVFADGKFLTALSEAVLAEAGWREGDDIDQAAVTRYAVRDEYGKALHKAYDYLARRQHASFELAHKLRQKKFDPALVNEVIDHLTKLGYLDDTQFAKSWVASRGRSRGPVALRHELRKKGVGEDIITRVLDDHLTDVDLVKEAEVLAKKKIAAKREPWSIVYPKLARYLAGRGYPPDVVREALSRVKDATS